MKTYRVLPFLACLTAFLIVGCDTDMPSDGGMPEDSGVESEEDASNSGPCTSADDCDNGSFCDGVELCDPANDLSDARGCLQGPARDCDDGISCTEDVCSESSDSCEHIAPDVDGDGHEDSSCLNGAGMTLGDDCDDQDANRFPGNTEVCNGGDEDCNPDTLGFLDSDGDGAASNSCCNPQADGTNLCASDCRDDDSTIRPGVADGPTMNCDNIDNDCDGLPDEGCPCVDGLARDCGAPEALAMVGICAPGQQFCVSGGWTDTCTGEVRAEMEFCDTRDNDCDGMVDEAVETTYYRDADGDSFGVPDETASACSPPEGFSTLSNDCNDGDPNIAPGATEVCDRVDNNCSMGADEGCACVDGDTQDCGPSTETGECVIGTQRCEGGAWGTCVGAVLSSPELCNGRDDDCDGTIDDGVQITYYTDTDGDGFGLLSAPGTGCAVPVGASRLSTDCNDGASGINPAAAEVCDGIDNNCSGSSDPGCACTNGATMACGPSSETGECNRGTQRCIDGTWAECVGAIEATPETCNGRDDDCDGSVDDGVQITYYTDADGDGFGRSAAAGSACAVPVGSSRLSTDCDDSASGSGINPAAFEACDGIDNNCDGMTDPGCACTNGATMGCGTSNVGVCNLGTQVCIGGAWTDCGGNREPDTELCNGLDDDCDGTIDDGVTMGCYEDRDGDTYGFGPLLDTCPGGGGYGGCPTGFSSRSNDCNDGSAGINPGEAEVCNAIDDNCDGIIDNGGGMECAQNSILPCQTACATAGQRSCSDSCIWNESECAAVTETCNYCDDDRDGTAVEDSGLALSTIAYLRGACNVDYDVYGSVAACFSSQNQVTLTNNTNQVGAIWREEPIYVGYDGFEVTVSTTVLPCGGAATGAWALVFATDVAQNIGSTGILGGLPTSSRGLAARWSFNGTSRDSLEILELTGSGSRLITSGFDGIVDVCGNGSSSETQTMRFHYRPALPGTGQMAAVEVYEVRGTTPTLIAFREDTVLNPLPDFPVGTVLRFGITGSTGGSAHAILPVLPPRLRSINTCDGPFDGHVRIDGGGTSGRVEIFHQGQWGTVCDDSFSATDARVVCRQLGLNGGSARTDVSAGTGPIWLDDLGCGSSAIALSTCPNPGWGVHNCVHTDDVGVTCSP